MNCIDYCINNVSKIRIPNQVLELSFPYIPNDIMNSVSLTERIINQVIRPVILTDLNVLGGTTTEIRVNQCIVTEVNDDRDEYIIQVPKRLTDGRAIIRAMSIIDNFSIPLLNSSNVNTYSPSRALRASNTIMQANQPIDIASTSDLEVVGENLILVRNFSGMFRNAILKVEIENPKNLENIPPRYYNVLNTLMTAGIKSYIYNNTIIDLDEGMIIGGHSIGKIKDIIESYSDQTEVYDEKLKEWRKYAFMIDKKKYHSYIKNRIGLKP